MSIYDNEIKIYPDLNPTEAQEPQTYWLKKLTEIEAYLLDEIEVRERIAKKDEKIQWSHWYCLGIALSETSLLLSLAMAIAQKSFKSFTVKQEKHDPIKLLVQSKLGSIANIISQAIQDGDISPTEFHKVLLEVEKDCKLKADIRNQAKTKVNQITKE